MLGKTQNHSAGTRARAPKVRERAVDFHVTIPAGDDAVTRRLVRRIQNSIDRTLASEVKQAPSSGAATKPATNRAAQSAAPGCGAWWAF